MTYGTPQHRPQICASNYVRSITINETRLGGKTMNRRTHRKLTFQQLENRLTLAGNVIASVSSHSLYLTGDSRANNLQIVQLANGQYQVTGKDGTTINGQAQKTFSGVTADLIVNLNGGNDVLYIGYYAENVA